MKVLVVLTFEVAHGGDVVRVLEELGPQTVAGFAGIVRVTVEPFASEMEAWLDADETVGP